MPHCVKVVCLGEFDLNPNMLVPDLSREYGLAISNLYAPHPPRVNPMSSHTDNLFTCFEFMKWREAMQRTDWSIEGYFGHNRLDCCLCCRGGSSTDNGCWRTSTEDSMLIVAPMSIYVLGECNSGTKFVSNMLVVAFDPPNKMGSNLEKCSINIPVLLHKHMFRHKLLKEGELGKIKARDDIL